MAPMYVREPLFNINSLSKSRKFEENSNSIKSTRFTIYKYMAGQKCQVAQYFLIIQLVPTYLSLTKTKSQFGICFFLSLSLSLSLSQNFCSCILSFSPTDELTLWLAEVSRDRNKNSVSELLSCWAVFLYLFWKQQIYLCLNQGRADSKSFTQGIFIAKKVQ